MQVRYRYRLYPHPHQQAAPARAFGYARVVWNDALALSQYLYKRGEKYPGGGELQKLCITQANQLEPNGKAVGIDLGSASLAVTSDGEKIAPPKFLRSACKRLRSLQRSLSRKVKGFNNRAKARSRLAKAHAAVADKRLDHLHKLSSKLIRENQTVVLEDLNVSGMMRNRKLACAIADAGWRMLRALLEAKAEQQGRRVVSINRWLPTSRICSACGHGEGTKDLSVRAWKCSACGAEHDRDWNIAQSILAAGLAERLNACGVESKTDLSASGSEAGTHLNQGVQLRTA